MIYGIHKLPAMTLKEGKVLILDISGWERVTGNPIKPEQVEVIVQLVNKDLKCRVNSVKDKRYWVLDLKKMNLSGVLARYSKAIRTDYQLFTKEHDKFMNDNYAGKHYRIHKCRCGWIGLPSMLKHRSDDGVDQHECPNCLRVLINNLQ